MFSQENGEVGGRWGRAHYGQGASSAQQTDKPATNWISLAGTGECLSWSATYCPRMDESRYLYRTSRVQGPSGYTYWALLDIRICSETGCSLLTNAINSLAPSLRGTYCH
jgi:hypothetical protein